jgi:hypothetical protein
MRTATIKELFDKSKSYPGEIDMPLLDILNMVEDQDRKAIWTLAEKYPFLVRFAEMGEKLYSARPRLQAIFDADTAALYEGDPDSWIDELQHWQTGKGKTRTLQHSIRLKKND